MDAPILERRRLLRFLALGSVAVPAMIVAGCANGSGGRRTRPPQFGGGNNDKPGNGGGMGGRGSNGGK